MPLIYFLFSAFGSQEKFNSDFFSVKFSVKIYRCILCGCHVALVSEMLKMSRVTVEAHFFKKLYFVSNKCLAQDAFGECPRTIENLSKYTAVHE